MKYEFKYALGNLPLIDIFLIYKNEELHISALLDTGADYTIFPRDVTDRLGIRLEQGEKEIIEGVGEGKIIVYKHNVKIRIGQDILDVAACFSSKNDVPENILGRVDLLKNFKVILIKNKFVLEEDKE